MLKKLQVITLLVDWPREQLSLPNETLFWSNLNYNQANTNQVEKILKGPCVYFVFALNTQTYVGFNEF